MDIEKVLCMNGGDSHSSYANNSSLQMKVTDRVRDTIRESIQQVYVNTSCPESFGIAELGCSSGRNSLSIIGSMIKWMGDCSRNTKQSEIRVYLNDLPANDFNSVFAALPEYLRELRRNDDNIFVAISAGSFYGRLFPTSSLHFIHSSNSLHWISQVPAGVYNEEGKSMNRGNIYISETTPPQVCEAYVAQFRHDFGVFLKARSQELTSGGRMVLILLSRLSTHHHHKTQTLLWKLLHQSLALSLPQGEDAKEMLDSYEVPFYAPCKEEVDDVVRKEGSFEVDVMEVFQVEEGKGVSVGRAVRAIQESMIRYHFGDSIDDMDGMFQSFEKMVERVSIQDITPHHLLLVLNKR